MKEKDKKLFHDFIKKIAIIDLTFNNSPLIESVTQIRSLYKIKLPDAIIAGSAIIQHAALITKDSDFAKIASLQILSY